MLTEQTYLLARGRKAAKRYALGAFLTVFVFIALATLFGRVISLPTEPTLSASLDVGLGALLVVLGGVLYLIELRSGRGSRRKQEKQRSVSDRRAFAFGIFSMATNLTTLALVLPAAKIIAFISEGVANACLLFFQRIKQSYQRRELLVAISSFADVLHDQRHVIEVAVFTIAMIEARKNPEYFQVTLQPHEFEVAVKQVNVRCNGQPGAAGSPRR